MRNAKFELDRLRYSLLSKGFSEYDADSVCDEAAQQISIRITDAMANSMSAVAEAALMQDAHEFVMEMKMIPRGEMFIIGTESGKTDFSQPPFPMLDKLLKNGKIAKDGSLYKVIPVGKSGGRPKLAVNIGDVQSKIQGARESAMQAKDVQVTVSRTINPMMGPARFSEAASFKGLAKKQTSSSSSGASGFRTASSKQDASTSWVLPEKNKDMTDTVNSANEALISTVEDIIMSTIREFEEGF